MPDKLSFQLRFPRTRLGLELTVDAWGPIIMVMEAMNSGISGVQRGMMGVASAANDIARQNIAMGATGNGAAAGATGGQRGSSDITTPLVRLGVSERDTEASVNVLRAADQMLGTLIDVMA